MSDFLTRLLDRKVYDVAATESLAVGQFDRRARPWPYHPLEPTDTHFSGALFEWNTPESATDFRRTKDRWTGAICIVLDDVGTKAQKPPVEPTAIIETSPGNQQWIFAFNEIVRDRALIETIQRSAIAGGLSDPEAGNITRITRLPDSLPKGKKHRAKLVWADWSRRFNAKAFVEKALQVPVVQPPKPQPIGDLCLTDNTGAEGQAILERACHKIRTAEQGTIANEIYRQAFFVGRAVGSGLIAPDDAESALYPAGTVHDRGDSHVRNGLRDGLARPLPRGSNGRFVGRGARRSDDTEPHDVARFQTPDAARAHMADTIRRFLADKAGVMAVAATPGAGKSETTRLMLAEMDMTDLDGDVVFYLPTLTLAMEAAASFEAITGTPAHVTRGRSAINPITGEAMCARSELAERVARSGLIVKTTLCLNTDAQGNTRACPFYAGCKHVNQWKSLPEHPVVRFEATAYLSNSGDGSGRSTALRVIDEKIWPMFSRQADISPDEWTQPRRNKDNLKAVDATACAERVLTALQAGQSPVITDAGAFSEHKSTESVLLALNATPDSPDNVFEDLLDQALPQKQGTRAALWSILADCAERGIENTERVRLIETKTGPKIRLNWLAEPPRDVPVLLLDADITEPILERLYPGAELVRVDLKPNADVIQLTDRTFSNAKLKKQSVRKEAAAMVRAIVMWTEGDVLVGMTRKAVKAMFQDAGHDFTGLPEKAASEYMLNTPLHGARWLWFGPASLGRNDWQDFQTVVIFGREEMGTDAIEDKARSLFGDSDTPLQFVEPDEEGRRMMPEADLPVTTQSGETWTIAGRAHPCPLTRALQEQTRERAGLQTIERLRLVNASQRKLVINCTTVPVPGLPVTELKAWHEIVPTRLEAAVAEAAQRSGVLRLSASGLHADAPETFPTIDAAKHFVKGDGCNEIEKIRGRTGIKTLLPVMPLKSVKLRIDAKGARTTRAIVFGDRDTAEAALGPLAVFEAVETIQDNRKEQPC